MRRSGHVTSDPIVDLGKLRHHVGHETECMFPGTFAHCLNNWVWDATVAAIASMDGFDNPT